MHSLAGAPRDVRSILPSAMPQDENLYRFAPAFERVRARIEAVPVSALRPMNFDAAAVGARALGATQHLATYRPRLARLVEFNLELVDALPDLAQALLHIHAAGGRTDTRFAGLPAQVAAAVRVRDQLRIDVESLYARGIVPRPAARPSRRGYRHVAMEVLTIADIFRRSWAEIAGRTAVTSGDLDGAEALAAELLRTLGTRAAASRNATDAGTLRAQAFTLVAAAHAELRRGLVYLLGAEEADRWCPSLFGGRRPQRRRTLVGGVAERLQPSLPIDSDPAF
jgi:hypothetical protein